MIADIQLSRSSWEAHWNWYSLPSFLSDDVVIYGECDGRCHETPCPLWCVQPGGAPGARSRQAQLATRGAAVSREARGHGGRAKPKHSRASVGRRTRERSGRSPHNPGFLTVVLPGSPGYVLYPSAQVPLVRMDRAHTRGKRAKTTF